MNFNNFCDIVVKLLRRLLNTGVRRDGIGILDIDDVVFLHLPWISFSTAVISVI